MKKTLFTARIIMTVCLCLCILTLLTACDDGCKNISNAVKNYYLQTISLKSGEEYTLNVRDIFQDSGLKIEKYRIEAGSNKNYTVRGDTIIATGTGVSEITVSLFCPSEDTRYVCSLGTLYSYDEKDFTPVSTASELQSITDLNGRYILTGDIDLDGIDNWQPIGNFPAENAFTGMFINPNGYKIKNLTITSAAEVFHGPYGGCCGGLFGSVNGAFLYGINLENVNIDVSDFDGKLYSEAGGLVAETNSTYIKNCSVSGNIKAIGRTGGIVGSVSWGCIENCTFSGSVVACETLSEYALTDDAVGAGSIVGFAGIPCLFQVYKYGIIGCSAQGNVTAVKNAGGIAGYIWGGDYVKDCAFSGQVTAASSGDRFGTVQK